MAKTLADCIRLRVLRFSYTNESLVPKSLPFRQESIEQFVAKSSTERSKGEELVRPTPEVGGLLLLDDFRAAGDELVAAFSKRQSRGGKASFVSQFEFVGREHVRHFSEDFLDRIVDAIP